MATKIPINDSPYQLFSMNLVDGFPDVMFFVWWNTADSTWNLSLRTQNDIIFGMKRLVARQWVMPNRNRFNGGDLIVSGNSDPVTIDAFVGENNLIWFEGQEIETS